MLAYNEVKERRYIVLDGAPYEVLSSHVFRKQQRKPVNATKLKHLITGKVVEHSFAVSDKVAEAEIEERPVIYLYHSGRLPAGRQEYWFCEAKDKSQRFKLEESVIGDQIKFVKSNSQIGLLAFAEQPFGVRVPVKAELKVKEAAPAVKGNTVQGGSKKVILETGAELTVPMFVNEGDVVVVNTTTGEYVSRV
jgi:elongation factor P